MKVYTYHEEIKFKHQNQLLEFWKKSWERQGFLPIVLTRSDAESHPDYENFVNKIKVLHKKITEKELTQYGLACWLRWMAYAMQKEEKFYVSDYDVINHSFKPKEPENVLHLMDSACPCVASGTASQFNNLCKDFITISEENIQEFIEIYKKQKCTCFHDQDFFVICNVMNKPVVKMTRERRSFLGAPQEEAFWEKQLVHYAHSLCKSYCEQRAIVFNEQERCNIIEKYLNFKSDNDEAFVSECLRDLVPCCGGVRNNDGNLNQIGKELTLIGIKNLLPAINCFLKLVDIKLAEIEKWDEETKKTETSEKLKELFNKYGSDKSCAHDYHLVYGEVFSRLDVTSPLNILEIGLGSQNPSIASRMRGKFSAGSSIRAYKEYFPNSRIFGADIDKDVLFTEERIQTSYVDQLNPKTLEEMHKNFECPSYDLIIEDGLHSFTASLNTLNFALKYTKKGGVIVLEDLGNAGSIWNIITTLLIAKGYKAKLINSRGLMLVIYL